MATSNEKRNIVIIGAGIIGCCTAYYVTRHPAYSAATHTLSILEASSPASGASGKAGGLISLDMHEGPTVSLARLSFSEHAKLAARHNGEANWEYRRLDVYEVHVRSDVTNVSRGLNIATELDWLDQEGLSILGASEEGTTKNMAQVHPYKFTTSILSLAQEKGAQLIHGRCTSLNPKSVSYTTESGKSDLPADTIIVTAGPWTSSLLPSIPMSAFRAHSIIIEPSSPLPPQGIFFSYKSSNRKMTPELYSRPSSVYICGQTDKQHALPDYAHDVIVLEKQISDLEAFAKQISTRLADGKIVTKQACYLPVHARGFPTIGWIESPRRGRAGVYIAAGHAVWGISLGPGTGKVVADMVVGGNTGKGDDWDITKLAP